MVANYIFPPVPLKGNLDLKRLYENLKHLKAIYLKIG